MRRGAVGCVLGILFVLLSPRPAHAELGFWRWWDSLSGPGPFSGVIVDPVFLCYRTLRGAEEPGPLAFDFGCYQGRRDRLRINIGVTWGRLDGKNNLTYAPPRDQSPPEVHVYPLFATAAFSRHPVVEVGGGIGFVRFSGDGFGFWRFAMEPRITVRPLTLLRPADSPERRRLEFLQLRLSGTAMPGEFTAADFGAIGPFTSDAEWLGGFAVIIDLSRLIPTGARGNQ